MSRISTFIDYAYPEHAPFDYQRAFIDDYMTRWLLIEASRQVGKSVMSAHKATLKALAIPGYKHVWCSYTLDDCKEKIEYAVDLYARLREHREFAHLPQRIPIENRMELQFANRSRLLSVFMPRGKSKADVTLDEFPHYAQPRKIYRAALPILIHGGQCVIMGTPRHSGTLFARMMRREGNRFTAFKRARLFWWDCPIHCTDVALARRVAPSMSPHERVARFGTTALREIFQSLLLEDFQQEFELVESDDNVAFLSWELIVACTPTGDDEVSKCETVAELINKAGGRTIFAGYDVGRKKDLAVLSCFVREGGRLIERYLVTMRNKDFDTQEHEIESVMKHANVLRIAIDETGIGMQLAERAHKRWKSRVLPTTFTNDSKATMATNMKMLMEQGKVVFQASVDANFDMHSVKKSISASENLLLKVEHDDESETTDHHADRFWARALALSAYSDKKARGEPRIGWA